MSGYLYTDEASPQGYLFLNTPTRHRRMVADTTKDAGYLDDLMRILGNRASFGTAEHLEGLANSLIYDTDVEGSLRTSHARTRRANRRINDPKTYEGLPFPETLGTIAGTGANILGTLGGYATLLPRLPMWLAGRGLVTPAAAPAEFTRGYFDAQGGPSERMAGGMRQLADQPENLFNPMTGRGLAANMFYQPTMEGAGLGDLTPSAYLHRVLDIGGIE